MKLVECVPNISEGRRPEIYDAVAAAAASVNGVTLLNVDPGADTNRTVITFVGDPEAVLEGAYQLIQKGIELIDARASVLARKRLALIDLAIAADAIALAIKIAANVIAETRGRCRALARGHAAIEMFSARSIEVAQVAN